MKKKFIEFIADKTTGIVVSYTEEGFDKNNITAELCGYEILALPTPLVAPTSFGFAVGDWIDYFVPESERRDDEPPSSSGDGYFYDWLERGNDDWTTAFNLNSEFEVPGHWYGLSLYESKDYYSFYADNGDNIVVDAWCENGADITAQNNEALIKMVLI